MESEARCASRDTSSKRHRGSRRGYRDNYMSIELFRSLLSRVNLKCLSSQGFV